MKKYGIWVEAKSLEGHNELPAWFREGAGHLVGEDVSALEEIIAEWLGEYPEYGELASYTVKEYLE